MNTTSAEAGSSAGNCYNGKSLRNVPWQIWVVVVLLAVEGIFGNLPVIPQLPIAAVWFAAKCLFVIGLVRAWRWVFVLFLVMASIHVVGFSAQAPFVAFLNLVLIVLTASARRFYFPKTEAASTGLFARRWLKYSLWALLALLLTGAGLDWFFTELDRARNQRAVVEALKKAGRRIKIEYNNAPPVLFLPEIIGKDACRVFAVDASSVHGFDDEYASYLAKLPDLQFLFLADTQITDAGLKHVEGLTNVQYMMLSLTQITDAGLDHLKGLTKLQQLDLSHTKVTQDGIMKLQHALPKCKITK